MESNKTILKRTIYFILFLFIFIGVDQTSKYIIRKTFTLHQEKTLIGDIFVFHYLENNGCAWGALSGQQILLILLSSVAVIYLVYVYFLNIKIKKYADIMFVLILLTAGAIGNLIDRIVFHSVTDFLYFKAINFPVFNIADCYVVIGVILLLLLIFIKYRNEEITDEFHFFSKNSKQTDSMEKDD